MIKMQTYGTYHHNNKILTLIEQKTENRLLNKLEITQQPI